MWLQWTTQWLMLRKWVHGKPADGNDANCPIGPVFQNVHATASQIVSAHAVLNHAVILLYHVHCSCLAVVIPANSSLNRTKGSPSHSSNSLLSTNNSAVKFLPIKLQTLD